MINNNAILFLFAFAFAVIVVLLPAIPEQGEIIISSPGDQQRQQYFVKIRP